MDKYIVYYKGEPKAQINKTLIDRQGVNDNGLEIIKSLHNQKFSYIELMEGSDDTKELKELAKKIEDLEFKLQKEWKFPLSRNYHRWFEVPKCKCPKMDNAEYLGTDYRIITSGCPIHT